MADIDVPLSRVGFGKTRRRDAWWVVPAVIFTVLTGFLGRAAWFAGERKARWKGLLDATTAY